MFFGNYNLGSNNTENARNSFSPKGGLVIYWSVRRKECSPAAERTERGKRGSF